eukprot:bmy_10008T0
MQVLQPAGVRFAGRAEARGPGWVRGEQRRAGRGSPAPRGRLTRSPSRIFLSDFPRPPLALKVPSRRTARNGGAGAATFPPRPGVARGGSGRGAPVRLCRPRGRWAGSGRVTDSRRGLRPGAGCPAPAAHWLARVWERTRSRIHTPRRGASLNSQAAGYARSVPEPGTRGRGPREAVRPARPRPRAARGRTMPADTPGKLRASPRAGAPAGGSAGRCPPDPGPAPERGRAPEGGDPAGRGWQERGGEGS